MCVVIHAVVASSPWIATPYSMPPQSSDASSDEV